MKSLRYVLCAAVGMVTSAASADTQWMQHDGYTAGDAVVLQSEFQPGEIAAVRFEPQIECPCLVTDIALVFAGSVEPQNIGIKIWEDSAGTTEPGELLVHDFTTLTPTEDNVQMIDMRSSSVVVDGPFRLGIQSLTFGLPAVVNDADGTINENANFLLLNTGTFDWYSAVSQSRTGDFVLRASIDNAVLADVDNDGFGNDVDNCIESSNADQRDTDNDSIGNMCDADVAIPNDCVVNFADFTVYRDNFERVGDLDTDNNGDGVTNFVDFAIFASRFLTQPGPSASGCN